MWRCRVPFANIRSAYSFQRLSLGSSGIVGTHGYAKNGLLRFNRRFSSTPPSEPAGASGSVKRGSSPLLWTLVTAGAGATGYAFMFPDDTIKPFLKKMQSRLSDYFPTLPTQQPPATSSTPALPESVPDQPSKVEDSEAISQPVDQKASTDAPGAFVIADVVEETPAGTDSVQQHEVPASPETAAPATPEEAPPLPAAEEPVVLDSTDPCAALVAEAVKATEKAASEKCLAALNRQEELLDEDIERAEREFRIQMRKETNELTETLEKKHEEEMARLTAALEKEAEQAISTAVAQRERELLEQHETDVGTTRDLVKRMAYIIDALSRVKEVRDEYNIRSAQAHALAQAALAITRALDARVPFHNELIALRVVAQATECESAIVAAQAIPDPAADGVASVYELQTRWPRLAESVRQAALVPDEGATLAWHMYAKVMSKLTIQDRKGLGSKTEEVLVRAEEHVQHGDIESAARELATLEGLPAEVSQDWLNDAQMRVRVQLAVDVATAEAAALAAAFS